MGGASVTIAQILDAVTSVVADALVTAGDMNVARGYDELEEGVADEKTLEIYWEGIDLVSTDSQTHKFTLGNTQPVGVQEDITIRIDYYARQRSHIGEDMQATVVGTNAIRAKLKEQNRQPFGLDDAHTFQWRAERVTFERAGADYAGARFTLIFRVF
jgi:hypothetical protein